MSSKCKYNGFLFDFFSGNDSFIAFEEILYYAKHHQVDFVLLGGDLFHDTNPSKEALHRYDKYSMQTSRFDGFMIHKSILN